MNKISKNKAFILPILFLTLGILATWYLFFEKAIIDDNEKLLAGVISSLGLIIGIFQIWLNQVNTKRNKIFQLRYNEYQHQFDLINQLSKTLNKNMTSQGLENVHGLVSEIMTITNEVITFNRFQSNFLFPKIKDSEPSLKMKELLAKLLGRTDQLRKKIDDVEKKDDGMKEVVKLIEEMNWHNEVREILSKINENKDSYFKELSTYL